MFVEHTYRLKSSVIEMAAEVSHSFSPVIMWWASEVSLTNEEVDWLHKGLMLSRQSVFVEIKKLEWNPTDFQPEGLACVMLELVAKATDTPVIEIPVRFESNKYVFTFPEDV